MTSQGLRPLKRLACLMAALVTTSVMTAEAYAHSVRWPQNTCRVSSAGHCKKPKTILISLDR